LTVTGTATTIQGLTVGRGAGAVASNTAVGASALAANTSGGFNTAVGYQAGSSNTTGGAAITAFGYQAGKANTSGFVSAFGFVALAANTTGANNAAFGAVTLAGNTTGSFNTGIGDNALASNTTASNNTAVGYQAGYTNSTGANNVFLGGVAGYSSSGSSNLHVGYGAGYSSTGSNNTFVGAFGTGSTACGGSMTTGSKNTILGAYSGNQGGLDIRTASNYIVLSDGDGNPRGIFDNSGNLLVGTTNTVIWNTTNTGVAIGGASDPAIQVSRSGDASLLLNRTSSDGNIAIFARQGSAVGNISVTASATAYNTSSDYRLKNTIAPMTGALAKVALLKPCTYKWNVDGSDGEGFIAHELAEVCPHAVTGEKDAVDENGNPKHQGIDVSFLVATLTAAIQELKAEVDSLKAQINGASA
jgi:hypothetical protein